MPVGLMVGQSASYCAGSARDLGERFTLLIGDAHPGIVDATVARRVMSRIMIEIGEWCQLRASYMETLARASADEMSIDGSVSRLTKWTSRSGSLKFDFDCTINMQACEYVHG
jgi:hypothetical protein